jgi:thiol-disulfide isomerase/thioredoxin
MSAPQVVGLSRRSWLAVAGVTLAAGGVAYAMRRGATSSGVLTPAETAFWQQKFNQMDGNALPMAVFRGKPLIVNFWATWCPPCLAELPLLNAFYAENAAKGWQVLGLAVDQATSVKRFLARSPLSFPVAMAGFEGADLSRSLGNLSGGLPFTVVFGPAGDVRHRKIGQLSPNDLAAWKQLQLI